MSTPPWLPVVNSFLSSLGHIGVDGFEGLTARLCEVATGQRFRLSGSGQQLGQDSRTETGYGNRIKVEAKHYAKPTLDLRELTAEITQATLLGPDVDLWVLAASCAVSDQHAASLEEVARKLEIEVLFLDLGNDGLPRMAVLIASFPETVGEWLRLHNIQFDWDELRTAIERLTTEPSFGTAKEQLLQKLRSTLLGFEDARQRSNGHFLEVMGDIGNAHAAFGQKVAIRAPGVSRIRRVSIQDELVTWWAGISQQYKRGVVLGEEGAGKTWATMEWLADRVEAEFPAIVLVFSAYAEHIPSGETIQTFLPKLLAKWTRTGSEASWANRLARWLSSSPLQQPLILIVADGLNERPTVDWPSFFRTLNDKQWRNHVAVLATDRPGHWRPSCARAGLDDFQEITIGGYRDSELERALRGKGIPIASIPQELQTLIRKPRYCALVCEHFNEMKANADFTVERLMLLDAQHRAEAKLGAMTESAFIEVIRNLATYYRTNSTVHLSAIRTLLPIPDPDLRVHQEIIDGGLLVPHPGLVGRFTIERTRLIFGLGMLLAEELRDTSKDGMDRAQIEDRLARWFEPHPEMELKVDIAGAALFHSLVDDDYPPTPRRELLRYWLGARNWGDGAQQAFVDYVQRCPEDFIAVTEDVWSADRNLGAAQDVLAAAFTKHRDTPSVQPILIKAVHRWMGFVHSAGHPIMRHDSEREQRQRRDIETRVGHPLDRGPIKICGEQLTVIEDDGLLRLSRFGLLIMSAGKRQPFILSLVPWAVAAAIMGAAIEGTVADWVVRLSDEPLEEKLLEEVQRLFDQQQTLAFTAANILLRRIGTPAAIELLKLHPEVESESWQRLRERHAVDPCTSGFAWNDENCLHCMDRRDISPLAIIERLGDRLFDPSYNVPESLIERSAALLDIDLSAFRASLSPPIEQYGFDKTLPLLASRAPVKVASFVRGVARTLPERDSVRLYPLAIWFPDIALLFGPAEQQAALRSLELLHADMQRSPEPSTPKTGQDIAESDIFLAMASHLSTPEFVRALLRRPANALDRTRLEVWFDSLPNDEIKTTIEIVHAGPDDTTVIRALWYLSSVHVTLSEADRDRILLLAQSKSPGVRGTALRFAYLRADDKLGQRMADLGSEFREPTSQWDAMWGARVLIRFSNHLPFESVVQRLHPADAGYALNERGNHAEDVRLYGVVLNQTWETIIAASDPQIASLPILLPQHSESIGAEFPELAEESIGGAVFKNPTTTWGATGPNPQFSDFFRNIEEDTEKLMQSLRQRAETIISAWGTPALQWYGRLFSREALDQICQVCPHIAIRWAEAALRDGLVGETIRVRTATLLASLCPVLLNRYPELGLRLWKTLRTEGAAPVRLDTSYIAFEAADSPQADEARWQVVEECYDDASLSLTAFVAEHTGRQAWLQCAIDCMIFQEPLYRRAKGLTLASFSNMPVEEFDEYLARAKIEQTWVESEVQWLRANVQKNWFSQYWFRLFLSAESADTSWCALQMTMLCGDQRFFLWRQQDENSEDREMKRRLKFLAANPEKLEKRLDREKPRKDTLFGIKIEHGEIFPFLK